MKINWIVPALFVSLVIGYLVLSQIDDSKKYPVTVLGVPDSLSCTDWIMLYKAFNDEIIVTCAYEDGQKTTAVMESDEYYKKQPPFKASMGVYSDGFRFIY